MKNIFHWRNLVAGLVGGGAMFFSVSVFFSTYNFFLAFFLLGALSFGFLGIETGSWKKVVLMALIGGFSVVFFGSVLMLRGGVDGIFFMPSFASAVVSLVFLDTRKSLLFTFEAVVLAGVGYFIFVLLFVLFAGYYNFELFSFIVGFIFVYGMNAMMRYLFPIGQNLEKKDLVSA